MERLIEELTFVSPFDQAPSAIITAKSHLHSDQQFVAAGSTLEDLLFHRLGKEWESRNRLSMMLEQIQLARDLGKYMLFQISTVSFSRSSLFCLGPQVSTRFFRALSKKIGYHLHRYGRRAYDLGVEFNAVKAAEQIYTAVASRNCQKIVRITLIVIFVLMLMVLVHRSSALSSIHREERDGRFLSFSGCGICL